ncbi:hypothetical protein ACFLWS_03440 [Chloroflexota bacterium]
MSPKVYVLIDITPRKTGWVVRSLRAQSGVLMADEIEDGSRVVVVLAAPDRQRLAQLTTQALSVVEPVTEGMQLLPTRNEQTAPASAESCHQVRVKSRAIRGKT